MSKADRVEKKRVSKLVVFVNEFKTGLMVCLSLCGTETAPGFPRLVSSTGRSNLETIVAADLSMVY